MRFIKSDCRNFGAIILLFLFAFNVNAFQKQIYSTIIDIDAGENLKEIATLPKHINEASGLEITKGKYLWTHNDGGVPILYCLDTLGNLLKTLQLNHPNSGWEDLTQDSKGNFYIGAFGNNKNNKKSLNIYKIPKPDSITEKVFNAEVIKYSYSDQMTFPPAASKQNFDMDAFVAIRDSLYLFSKNRTTPFSGYTKIYSLPQTPGEYKVTPIDSIYLGKGPMMDKWITSADISPDGKTVALLSHQYVWLIKNFHGNNFSKGKFYKIKLNHFSHKAGLCFKSNQKLFIVDELEMEILGGKIYSLDLQKLFINPQ